MALGSEGFGGGAAAEVDIVCFEERNLTEGVGAVYYYKWGSTAGWRVYTSCVGVCIEFFYQDVDGFLEAGLILSEACDRLIRFEGSGAIYQAQMDLGKHSDCQRSPKARASLLARSWV